MLATVGRSEQKVPDNPLFCGKSDTYKPLWLKKESLVPRGVLFMQNFFFFQVLPLEKNAEKPVAQKPAEK